MSLEIRKSFSGRGLFATREFRKGEFIIEYFGTLLNAEEADRKYMDRYLFEVTANKFIDGKGTANVARYINHSCKPNVEARGLKRLFIRATRKIRPGDEIFLDYGQEYIERFIESCKCPVCKPGRSGKKRATKARGVSSR
jgi:SET domain-containing protein